jgi:hypothetical protein
LWANCNVDIRLRLHQEAHGSFVVASTHRLQWSILHRPSSLVSGVTECYTFRRVTLSKECSTGLRRGPKR